jgi:hypothetical protein
MSFKKLGLILLALTGWSLAVVFFTGCATVYKPVPVVIADIPKAYAGVTLCDLERNEPIIFIQPYVWKSNLFGLVLQHEMVHVRQSTNFDGGCREFGKRYENDALFRFDTEAEAYCEVLRTYYRPDYYREGLHRVLNDMYQGYGEGMTRLEVEARVMRYCGRPP